MRVFFLLEFGTVPTEWGYFFYYFLEPFRHCECICSINIWKCPDRVGVFFSINVWNCSDRVRVFVLLVFGTVPTEWRYFFF